MRAYRAKYGIFSSKRERGLFQRELPFAEIDRRFGSGRLT